MPKVKLYIVLGALLLVSVAVDAQMIQRVNGVAECPGDKVTYAFQKPTQWQVLQYEWLIESGGIFSNGTNFRSERPVVQWNGSGTLRIDLHYLNLWDNQEYSYYQTISETLTSGLPGSVSVSDAGVCAGDQITLTWTGSGTFMAWKQSLNNWASESQVGTENPLTIAVGSLDVRYRAEIMGACGVMTTAQVMVDVESLPSPGYMEIEQGQEVFGSKGGEVRLVLREPSANAKWINWEMKEGVIGDNWQSLTGGFGMGQYAWPESPVSTHSVHTTTTFRATAQSDRGCLGKVNALRTIMVMDPPVAGSIAGPEYPLNCHPIGDQTFRLQNYSGNITWYWQRYNDVGAPYWNEAGTGATLVIPADAFVDEGVDYLVVIKAEVSNGIDVVEAGFAVQVRTIDPGRISADKNTVCVGGSVILSVTGNEADISKWQRSATSDFAIFSDFSDPAVQNMRETAWFRAAFANNCGGFYYTSPIQVSVDAALNPLGVALPDILACRWQTIELQRWNEEENLAYHWYDPEGQMLEDHLVNELSYGQYTYKVKTFDGNCESAEFQDIGVTITNDCDENLNWVEAVSFDENGEKISRSKNYFDLGGRQLQSQHVVFSQNPQEVGDVVFATQTLADALEREVLATLPAPVKHFDRDGDYEVDFRYDGYFMLDEASQIYDYENFDASARLYLPDPVGASEQGTLGWYYSDANTLEPYTPVTKYPYTRKEYYDDGSGEPKRVAGPGDHHYLGSGHETLSGIFPVAGELEEYSQLRGEASPFSHQANLSSQAVMSVSVDANDRTVVSIMDKGEKVLMTAESGGDIVLNSTGTTDVAGDKKVLYFGLLQDGTVSWSGSGRFTLTDIISNLKLGTNLGAGTAPVYLKKGFYKVSHTSGENIAVSYTNRLASVSYNFYDDAGRLVSSVSPNGVKAWRGGTAYALIDKTTYVYNHQGRLLQMTEPDAGTTRYMHRKDGSIRFSQNAEQALSGRFSYTHYDRAGRPVESGAYKGSLLTFDNPALAQQQEETYREYYENHPKWRRGVDVEDWVFTAYDLPDTEALQEETGLEGLQQQFLMGAVSWSENEHMKTWYSYDYRGRVTWMVQKPKAIDGSELDRVFRISYSYDFLGNVTDVVFEAIHDGHDQELPAERFYHHYEYDNNQRLVSVRAGENPEGLELRARYEYYLHGPLKRIELGEDKQGIDYTYTIQGWLKTINHPDGNRDPGKDGRTGAHSEFEEDLFAMTLEYFDGDYERSGTGISSLDAGKEYFNGNIRNASWRTGARSHGVEPVMYAYRYDNKYQLTGADFGTPDYTNNAMASLGNQYRVSDLKYDANGNILGLTRFDGMENTLHDFTNAYQYAQNKNQLTGIERYSDYEYNDLGQLVREAPLEGDIRRMQYDVTGKVTAVTTDDVKQLKVDFTYDDRGFRLRKKNHETGAETWYVRDASGNVLSTYEKTDGEAAQLKETMLYGSGRIGMYRHDFLKTKPDVDYITGSELRNEFEDKDYQLLPGASLSLIEGFTFDAASGKSLAIETVVMDELTGAAQYELSDHLGNVRIGLMEESSTMTFDATMEQAKAEEEERYFMNMDSRHNDALHNHTAGGSWSARLNPVGGQTIGPAITLEVSPGDTVRMEVFCKYLMSTAGNSDLVAAVSTAIAVAFGNVSPVIEYAGLESAFTEAFAAGAAVPTAANSDVPKAYLQYIVFDKEMRMARHGYQMVTRESLGNWEKLRLEVPVRENGYIYIYVANESKANVDVFFDDIEVQMIDAPVTSANDYYPFGLTMKNRSYTSEDYRFGYQGQFAEMDEETGWNAFELRMFEPVIGRWMATDPYGQFLFTLFGDGKQSCRWRGSGWGLLKNWSKMEKFTIWW